MPSLSLSAHPRVPFLSTLQILLNLDSLNMSISGIASFLSPYKNDFQCFIRHQAQKFGAQSAQKPFQPPGRAGREWSEEKRVVKGERGLDKQIDLVAGVKEREETKQRVYRKCGNCFSKSSACSRSLSQRPTWLSGQQQAEGSKAPVSMAGPQGPGASLLPSFPLLLPSVSDTGSTLSSSFLPELGSSCCL